MSGPEEPGGFYVAANPRRPRSPGQSIDDAFELDKQAIEACSDQLERLRGEVAQQAVQLAELQGGHQFLTARLRDLEGPPSS